MKTIKKIKAIMALVLLSTLPFCVSAQKVYKVDSQKSNIGEFLQKQIDNAGNAQIAVAALIFSGNSSIYIPDSIIVNDKNMEVFFHSTDTNLHFNLPILEKQSNSMIVSAKTSKTKVIMKCNFFNEQGSNYMKIEGNDYLVYKQQ